MFLPHVTAMSGYVPGEQPREGDVVKLNTNENPYQCSPTVKGAIGRVCQAGLQKYPDPAATEFRAAAAELFAADVPGITPEWIVCGNGSDDLLTIVTRACVGAGDHVRFPRPSYVLYDTLAAIQGAKCDVVDFEPDWTLGPRFVKPCDKLRLAYLPNPNSPSGTVLAPAEVGRIAAALPCPLIVDEAYADFAEENCLRLVAENPRVIVTRTLSKSYALAGLRFGFAIAQPQVIAELVKVKDSYNCDALAIAGATAALRDRPWFDRTRAAVLATRERLLAELRRRGFACVDSQANFVWCRPPGGSPRGLYESLKRANILVRYMPYGDWGDGLRVTVGTDAQIDVLLAKLDELI